MKIQVKSVGPVTSKQGPKAAYSVFELIYAAGGKVGTKNIMEFSKDAFLALKDAQAGDWFEVEKEKTADGKYSNWTTVKPTTADTASSAPASSGAPASTGKSGWQPDPNRETPAERAAKQVYIVRQSSLANAVAYLATLPKTVTEDVVLSTAKRFEEYVFAVGPKEPDIGETDDDGEVE